MSPKKILGLLLVIGSTSCSTPDINNLPSMNTAKVFQDCALASVEAYPVVNQPMAQNEPVTCSLVEGAIKCGEQPVQKTLVDVNLTQRKLYQETCIRLKLAR